MSLEIQTPVPTVLGFNCGIGNLLGFHQENFIVKAIIDERNFIRKGIKAFTKNFPGIEYSNNEAALNNFLPINVIISSPSCAQVSSLGIKREDRTNLWDLNLDQFEFIRVLKLLFEHSPDFIVVEYLKSLTKFVEFTHQGLRVKNEILYFPQDYRAQMYSLNTTNFGVPQKRERLFYFFSKKHFNFVFMDPITAINTAPKNVGEILTELAEIRKQRILLNDMPMNHGEERTKRFGELKYGESYYGMHNNRKLVPNKICPTITSHCTQYVHPFEPRTLTVREVATFQGFPLDFDFDCSIQTGLDLAGRSISPVIAKHIAHEIKESLEKYYISQIGMK